MLITLSVCLICQVPDYHAMKAEWEETARKAKAERIESIKSQIASLESDSKELRSQAAKSANRAKREQLLIQLKTVSTKGYALKFEELNQGDFGKLGKSGYADSPFRLKVLQVDSNKGRVLLSDGLGLKNVYGISFWLVLDDKLKVNDFYTLRDYIHVLEKNQFYRADQAGTSEQDATASLPVLKLVK